MHNTTCPVIKSKRKIARSIINLAQSSVTIKPNLIWLELNGCSGNIISLMNAKNPDLFFMLNEMVTLAYNNSLMAEEGQKAFNLFLETLDTDFILVVEGAVSTKQNGAYNIIANYNGRPITGLEAVTWAGQRAKHILAVGTCASYGGISSAKPNSSESFSLDKILLDKTIIKIPGCPSHPDWVIGIIAHLLHFGIPKLDNQNRPIIFYGITIHDRCQRRSFFDKGIFAQKLGNPECMIKLGCKGPVTKTDCPVRRWNDTINWPVETNTPCIGCAQEGFPDGTPPFVKY